MEKDVKAKDVKITLHVEAAQLWSVGDGKTEVDNYCWLTDDNSGSNPLKPREFESEVYRSKEVRWRGRVEGADSEDYEVSIDSIDHEKGAEIFGENPIVGKSGKVKAKVESFAPVGSLDTYLINFHLTSKSKPGMTSYSLTIDPKLKVDPT